MAAVTAALQTADIEEWGKYEILVDRNARHRNLPENFGLELFTTKKPTTYILAAIRSCILQAADKEMEGLDIHFYSSQGSLDVVDIPRFNLSSDEYGTGRCGQLWIEVELWHEQSGAAKRIRFTINLSWLHSENYKGAGMKFAPTWKGSIAKFGSLIGSTEMLVSNGKVCIDIVRPSFYGAHPSLIESTTMKAEANIYVSVMDQTGQQINAIDALLAAYGGISDEVSHSKSTFEQRMIQVSPLTIDIQSAKPDMDYIKEQLGLFRDSAKIFQNLWVVVFRILDTVKEADDADFPDIRNVEIERVAKSKEKHGQIALPSAPPQSPESGGALPASTLSCVMHNSALGTVVSARQRLAVCACGSWKTPEFVKHRWMEGRTEERPAGGAMSRVEGAVDSGSDGADVVRSPPQVVEEAQRHPLRLPGVNTCSEGRLGKDAPGLTFRIVQSFASTALLGRRLSRVSTSTTLRTETISGTLRKRIEIKYSSHMTAKTLGITSSANGKTILNTEEGKPRRQRTDQLMRSLSLSTTTTTHAPTASIFFVQLCWPFSLHHLWTLTFNSGYAVERSTAPSKLGARNIDPDSPAGRLFDSQLSSLQYTLLISLLGSRSLRPLTPGYSSRTAHKPRMLWYRLPKIFGEKASGRSSMRQFHPAVHTENYRTRIKVLFVFRELAASELRSSHTPHALMKTTALYMGVDGAPASSRAQGRWGGEDEPKRSSPDEARHWANPQENKKAVKLSLSSINIRRMERILGPLADVNVNSGEVGLPWFTNKCMFRATCGSRGEVCATKTTSSPFFWVLRLDCYELNESNDVAWEGNISPSRHCPQNATQAAANTATSRGNIVARRGSGLDSGARCGKCAEYELVCRELEFSGDSFGSSGKSHFARLHSVASVD
ncbi:hypothetical protein B0H12DRAFT_1083276 [Mycena haematopus]|nr:hypothetical protein B0H12DRAFT_1083276 [Mycena haematopus]